MNSGVLKYGGIGTVQVAPGHENFAGATINGLSLTCTPIELLSNDGSDTILGHATGFFWRRSGRPYLITNWHVLSGRNPFTGELGTSGYEPSRFAFYGMTLAVDAGIVSFRRQRWITEWGEETIEFLRKPPQIDGREIDLWGIPIKPELVFGRDPERTGFSGAETATCFLSDQAVSRIATNVGDDCFILGYPLRNYEGFMPPIWKRGSIASETPLGLDGRPMFLVDAATMPGMSGSPILRRAINLTAQDEDLGAIREISSYEVVGIYAGRLESRELASVNLGYGWYRTVIDKVLDQLGWSELQYEPDANPPDSSGATA